MGKTWILGVDHCVSGMLPLLFSVACIYKRFDQYIHVKI
jgi:hypothetical protein